MSAKPSINNVSLLLTALEGGAFHDDVSKAMRQVIQDLSDHGHSHGGKPVGELTINLKFKLDNNTMDIIPDFKTKTPKVARGRAVYFVTPEGGLTREDPRQMRMELDEAREKRYTGSTIPAIA